MLTLIAAVDEQNGIGKNGTIPWFIPEDLRVFQQETIGGAVIMGRKTFDSLNKKPLKNRVNFVITINPSQYHNPEENHKKLMFAPTSIGALELATRTRTRVYGIGGQRVYEELLPYADRILLTLIPGRYYCDTVFPHFDRSQWVENTRGIGNLHILEYTRKES